ncbi:MAG: hypothetical protein DRP84_03900 [Spirochaetes bacterium]|nr:MAG: hypothetical protein DRP84_03900 [Spirochaetota bacterium]
MGNRNRRSKGQIFILMGLIGALLFLIYNFICFSCGSAFESNLSCFVQKLFTDEKNQSSYYISSFLTVKSNEAQKMEVHRLIQKSINELKNVQRELKKLEIEHNKYVDTEGRIKSLINSLIYLFGDQLKFRDEITVLYNEKIENEIYSIINENSRIYENKFWKVNSYLLERKKSLERKINYLTDYLNMIDGYGRTYSTAVYNNNSIIQFPVKKLYAKTRLENKGKFIPAEIEINRLKNVLEDKKVENDDLSGSIEKMLNSLYQYTEESEKILNSLSKQKINREKAKNLLKLCERLEKRGAYEMALKHYRNILVFDLSPLEREIVLSKIEEINRKIVIDRIIRKENKVAAKLKVEADHHRKLDEIDKAKELYIRVIKEFPNSDYVDEAIEGLLECQKVVE